MGDIILTRENQEVFKLLDYKIYIDDEMVNKISNNTHKVVTLKEGNHQMYIKVLGHKSNVFNLKIKSKETIRLTCKNEITGFKYLFSYLYIFSKGLLKLQTTEI